MGQGLTNPLPIFPEIHHPPRNIDMATDDIAGTKPPAEPHNLARLCHIAGAEVKARQVPTMRAR